VPRATTGIEESLSGAAGSKQTFYILFLDGVMSLASGCFIPPIVLANKWSKIEQAFLCVPHSLIFVIKFR